MGELDDACGPKVRANITSATEVSDAKLFSAIVVAALATSLTTGTVSAGGPPSLAFYVDGVPYRTVGTPTDFSQTGAPDHSFDRIYALGAGLVNVAEAAPGQPGYNGGRWMVLPVTWHVTPVQLTSDEAVLAYAAAGWLEIGSTPIRLFECPVIPTH